MSWGYKPRRTLYAGGSSLLSMKLNEDAGWIRTYHLNRDLGKSQLSQMYAAGQRALKIVVSFLHNASDGTNLESTGGHWQHQDLVNLQNLLIDIKQIGFEEIILAYCPAEGGINGQMIINGPWDEKLYSETWNFIAAGVNFLEEIDISYRVDLQNEPFNNPNFIKYCQRLWGDGLNAIQNNDHKNLIGIHFSVGDWNNLDQVFRPYGYDPIYPNAYFIHFYEHILDYAKQIKAKLKSIGEDWKPWYIDECSDNDSQAAADFIEIAKTTTIIRRLSWPLTAGGKGNQDVISIAQPNYINEGF